MTANTLERPRIIEGQDFADLPPEPTIGKFLHKLHLPRSLFMNLKSAIRRSKFGNRAVLKLLDLDGDGDLTWSLEIVEEN